MRPLVTAFLVILTVGSPLESQTPAVRPPIRISDARYIAGKDGFTEKLDVDLLLTDTALVVIDVTGVPAYKERLAFAVPYSCVIDIANDTQIRDPSVGQKLLFGGLAGSRKQEFVQLTCETAVSAEGIVFQVKQGTSPDVTAKLRFAVKKYVASQPRDTSHATPDSVAGPQ